MNNVMDISSLLLIEDSADSEGDTGFFSLCPTTVTCNIGHNEDNNDAESCTCDTDGICNSIFNGGGEEGNHADDQGSGDQFCCDEDYDSEFINSSSIWLSEEEGLEIECSSSYSPNFLVEDAEVETRTGKKVNVNQVEDRMFWEICMAVGYP